MEEKRDRKEGLLNLLRMMGAPEFDVESYGRSESFQGILENQECMLENPDEGSPETLAVEGARRDDLGVYQAVFQRSGDGADRREELILLDKERAFSYC